MEGSIVTGEKDAKANGVPSGSLPDEDVALRLTDGYKSYWDGGEEHPVFQGVEFAVREGEVFVLLGATGCGKSTLLRTIAGLDDLTGGHMEVADGSKVGMVFQEPRLFPWLTAAENVGLGLRYRANRRSDSDGSESTINVMRDFGLSAVARKYPGELSGGQAQRVNLARTIVTSPDILLLDEPFSALDPRTRNELQDWLLDIVRRLELTVVFVTHDLEEATYLGDRVGLMSGSPASIAHLWDATEYRSRNFSGDREKALREDIMSKYEAVS